MSTFLNFISPSTYSYFFVTFLAVLVIALLVEIILLKKKLRKVLLGKNGADMSDSLAFIEEKIRKIESEDKKTAEHLISVEKRLQRSLQSTETIRFNPFKGTGDGGSQSFATAFLDEKGNGVVLSSIYSRDRVSIFSKPLKRLESEYNLSEEEEEVIKKANTSIQK